MEKIFRIFDLLNEQVVIHPATQYLWSFYKSKSVLHQLVMRIVLVVLAIALLWLFFLWPLASFSSRAQQEFIVASDDLIWMQLHSEQARRISEIEGKSIEDMVRESPLSAYIAQLTADSEMRVTLTLSDAPFNRIVEALTQLSRNNGIRITQATINRMASRSGYVTATLVMERN